LPSAAFGYDSLGRVSSVTDAANRSTTYQYNKRGQTTRVTHAVDGSYTQSAYNADGTLAWTADENHPGAATDPNQRTRFVYDDYKRVTSLTNPLNQTTTYNYAQDWANPYVHTTSKIKGLFSPMGKAIHYAYDENWRRTIMRVPPGNDPNDAWTFYGYDNAGNLTSVQDPRGNTTSIGYDQRNRRTSLTNPAPFNTEVTRWLYDAASNVIRETRPDQSYRRTLYDSMNRITDTYGFSNERIQYKRDLAGNITQLIDAKNATHGFGYDLLDRKISASYPADVYNIPRTESWRYDTVGNMDLYCNLATQYKHIDYDSRNRPWHSYWNWSATSTAPDWFGPETTSTFDVAGRVTSVATKLWNTNENETVVAFGYDDANRKIWEDQTLRGYATRRVETPCDADGNRAYLHVPGLYYTGFQYTQRNQLKSVDGFATFEYDLNGNMTRRVGQWLYPNGTWFSYDQLNRPITVDHGDQYQFFQHNHYKYDNVGREIATWRNEQSSKGERFWYNPAGQLTAAVYNADNVWATPSNWSHRRDYYYSAGLLNRYYVNDNGYWAPFASNGVNQYTNVNGQAPQYDGNLNLTGLSGLSASYDAENRLVYASRNGNTVQFTYDGLGRCVRRTVNGSTSRIFTYDGWKPMLEWDQAGNFLHWNMYGAGPDEILARNDGLLYKQDQHGNVVALLGSSNNILEKYTYDAFGTPKITDANGNVRTESAYGNRFMFTGREYLKELGIYDYRHRFYDPGLGRFLQRDPIGFAAGDTNLFRYCGDDPVNRRDPLGLFDAFFNPSPQDRAAWEAQAVMQNLPYSPHPSVINVYNGAVSAYNAVLPALNSPLTRQTFYAARGVMEVHHAVSFGSAAVASVGLPPGQWFTLTLLGLSSYSAMEAAHSLEESLKQQGFNLAPGIKWQPQPLPPWALPPTRPPEANNRGRSGNGGGGGEGRTGGSSGVSIGPTTPGVVGYANVDPGSQFFADLMSQFPNATVVPQSGPLGGGGKNIPIYMLH
jgi:RHS repeat-associated protein